MLKPSALLIAPAHLRQSRKLLQKSRAQVERDTGISYNTLLRVERGNRVEWATIRMLRRYYAEKLLAPLSEDTTEYEEGLSVQRRGPKKTKL